MANNTLVPTWRWATMKMKKHVIVACLGLAAVLTSGTGYACICPHTPSLEEFEAQVGQLGLDTWIFVGTATSSRQKTSTAIVRLKVMVGEVRELFGAEPYWAPDDLRRVVQFSIVENFRGPTSESKLEADSGACGPFFEIGKQYLVVATRKTHKDAWLAEGCTPTATAQKACLVQRWCAPHETFEQNAQQCAARDVRRRMRVSAIVREQECRSISRPGI